MSTPMHPMTSSRPRGGLSKACKRSKSSGVQAAKADTATRRGGVRGGAPTAVDGIAMAIKRLVTADCA